MEKRKTEKQAAPGGGGSIFGSAPGLPENKNVSVASGPYAEDLPVADTSVGEVRRKFADRLDIDPQSDAVVNGHKVGDDVILKAGESLMFVRNAGEKGAHQVLIDGTKASVLTGDGNGVTAKSMPLDDLFRRAVEGNSSGPAVLPTGVKSVFSRGSMTIWAWEKPPHIAKFQWIAANSPSPYGPGTKYRSVRIALPYLIILAVFGRDNRGLPTILGRDECFFRNAPLKHLSDPLHYPGLLNCSKYPGDPKRNGTPLSWICTQHLKRTKLMGSANAGDRFVGGFEAVRYCLLETAFNLSSEHHEGNSWYGASKHIDPRIATIEAWEENTKKDPIFVLDVPWTDTGYTLEGVANRIFERGHADDQRIKSSADLARIILNS